MTRRRLIIIAIAVLLTGVLIYIIRPGIMNALSKDRAGSSQASTGHEGHVPAAPSLQKETDVKEPSANEEAPTIEIPEDKHQLIGLKTVEVTIQHLQKVIRTVGRVEYDERRQATVNTKFEGWIEKLYVDYTGKYVRKGEPLAEIYSPELIATQQEFINALKWASGGQQRLKRNDREHALP